MVSNVVGEAQLPIAHEQARQKFEFHKKNHRNKKELRFTLLYSENLETHHGENKKRILPNYEKEQRHVQKVLIRAECHRTHSRKSELNALPYIQGI